MHVDDIAKLTEPELAKHLSKIGYGQDDGTLSGRVAQVAGVRGEIDEGKVKSEGLEEIREGEKVEDRLPGVATGVL